MEAVKENPQLQKYPAYKDSGVEWLGEIPEHWNEVKLKYIAEVKKGILPKLLTSEPEENLPPYLSMDYLRGAAAEVWVKDKGAIVVEDNELLLLWDGSNAGEFLKSRKGVISSTVAHISFSDIDQDFAKFYCHIIERNLRKNTVGMGIPHVNSKILNNSTVLIPPKQEQNTIANFLDKKCGKIDTAIAQKQQLIELLKERKQIIIQNAVTKGLDPDVKMKDSGVEWIGEIPEHWEVKRLKFLLDEINIRSTTGEEELLSLSKYSGIVPKSSLEERAGGAESNIGYKVVREQDLVINKMQAVNGLIAVSFLNGITSPDYSVYRAKDPDLLSILFLDYLIKQPEYLGEFKRRVTGVMEGFIRLYTDDFYDIEVHLPPKDEQNRMVNFIRLGSEKIDESIILQQQQIEKLKEYKSSLIDAAVTGKIKIK
ncbi:restriction endonuclease subunit S [Salinimicrobium sp. WS361]|uniref:restriction endonuclease subunit S n=1 Tax=Salinimicrobium sp. WS361 TaxID=3425123 RepID=UPI003D6DFDFA